MSSNQDKKQWAQTEMEEVPAEHQEAFMCCAGDGTLEQATQKGCGVSFLEIFRSHLDLGLGTLL